MTNQAKSPSPLLLILFFTLVFLLSHFTISVSAGTRRVHIPDDLDDVVDDEEDEEWKNWGNKKKNTPELDDIPPPPDFETMDVSQIQAEIAKQNSMMGPAVGFVKLRFGVTRTPESVSEIAMKWTRVLKTGGIELKFMGIDLSTIMFTLERGQDMEEAKDFILEQQDAYEVKIGDQTFRRPGDPPLEEIIEKLREEKDKASSKDEERQKEEL